MRHAVAGGSMVRKMFEEGMRLKATHGDDKVFDYSLGNPDLEPPEKFNETIAEIVGSGKPSLHGYMPNAGIPSVRESVAKHLSQVYGTRISPDLVIMTVGAAGGLNCVLKAICEPGDEIIVLAPFFMEYVLYADNHGARVIVVQTDQNFRPDFKKIAEAVTPNTRAVLINSPNNPTGVVYTDKELVSLGGVLRERSKAVGHDIVLIADEPYRKIVFGKTAVPPVFSAYENTVAVSSFSKDLSLAGERIGYLCANPVMEEVDEFMSAAILANRILGFVNAPALMQRAIPALLSESVDVGIYENRVETLREGLGAIGYRLTRPEGTFYLFPESPISDDGKFVELLKKELILAVPGKGFSRPGHFRLSLCLSQEKIERSLEGFKKAFAAAVG
jgi:aspartate aminotransferase